MFGDYSEELLRQGILELKAGNRDLARRYLDRALYMSSDHDLMAEGWYWMSQLLDRAAEQRAALESCLANNPQHSRGRRALAILDGKLKSDEIIDPDAPLTDATPDGTAARRFVCSRCGGRMAFSPDGGALVCEYCRRHEAAGSEAAKAAEQDFIVAMATRRGHGKPVSGRVMRCQGCGAAFVLPGRHLTFNCAYCNSPHVVLVETSTNVISPDGILPHKFDQRHATDVLAAWMHGLHLESDQPAGPPRGVYLPVWSFLVGGAIEYTGEIHNLSTDANLRATPMKQQVRDRYPVHLNVSVPASHRPSAPFVRLLRGFDLTAIRAYDARLLAAWPAELYDVSMAQASLEARSQGYNHMRANLPALVAPIKVLSTSSARLTIESFRLDLLPVWMTELTMEGQRGLVLINGRTGAVSGPVLEVAREKR